MDHREAAALLAEQNKYLILTTNGPTGTSLAAVGLCAALRKPGQDRLGAPQRRRHQPLSPPYLEGCLAPGSLRPALW